MTIADRMAKTQADHLLALWLLDERSGATLADSSGNGLDGTNHGATLADTVTPDGQPAPTFDNDYADIYSAGLNTAFDPDTGTLAALIQADDWDAGSTGTAVILGYSSAYFILIQKTATEDVLRCWHVAGGSSAYIDYTVPNLDPMMVVLTWDTDADELRLYINGAEVSGSPDTGLGTWTGSGPLTQDFTNIGRFSSVQPFPWYGMVAVVGVWDCVLTANEIRNIFCAWYFHPYSQKGLFWAYRPTVIFKAQVDATNTVAYGMVSGTSITQHIYFQSVTLGAYDDVRAEMTILCGSTPGGDDYGRTRLRGYGTGEHGNYLSVWVSPNIHDGELYLPDEAYLTVLLDYRVFAKTPYASGASYYFDGDQVSVGYVPDPVANAGPPVMEEIDTDGKIRVYLDASESYAGDVRNVLGGLTANLIDTDADLSVSSTGLGDKANLIDGDTGTLWASSTATEGEYILYDFGEAVRLRVYSMYAGGNPAPNRWYVRYRDDPAEPWRVAGHEMAQSDWVATPQTKTFYLQDVGAHRYWQWYFLVVNPGGAYYRVYELEGYAEDRDAGSSPWTWDVADGDIISGAVTDETLTVDFEGGHRFVTLAVNDNKAGSYPGGVHYKSVLAWSDDTHYYDLSGVTESASEIEAGYPASNAADEDHDTYWRTQNSTYSGWLKFQFASSLRYITGYALSFPASLSDDNAMYTWTFDGSQDDSNWDTLDTQTAWTGFSTAGYHEFDLDFPVGYEYYRLNVTTIKDASGTNFLVVGEMALYSDQGVLQPQITASRLTADESGQEFAATLHAPISLDDYPPGTRVMYDEQERFLNAVGPLPGASKYLNRAPKFWGFLDTEPNEAQGTLEGTRLLTSIVALDVGKRLQQVVGYNIGLERDENPTYAYQMRRATMDTVAQLIVTYCTNAAFLTDFFWSMFAEHYGFGVYDFTGNAPYVQADNACQATAMRFTCNKYGQLRMVPDLQLRSSDQRSYWGTLWATLDGADILRLRETHQRSSRFHWLWGKGIKQYALDADDGSFSVTPYQCVVPGEAPGQGVGLLDMGHQLVLDQDELNEREGNRYAVRMNAPHTHVQVEIAHRGDNGFDPAEVDRWITLTITENEAPTRGWVMTDQAFLITRIETQHYPDKGTKSVHWTLEAYRSGRPAVTVS